MWPGAEADTTPALHALDAVNDDWTNSNNTGLHLLAAFLLSTTKVIGIISYYVCIPESLHVLQDPDSS